MNDIGKSITSSISFIAKVGEQIESLVRLAKIELNKSIEEINDYKTTNNDWESDVRQDDNEWVVTDYAHCIALKPSKKGNHKTVGYLGIQISLLGDGVNFENNEVPLMHISWMSSAFNFNESCYFGIPLIERLNFTIENGVIFNWNPDADILGDQRWNYSLRLTSINSPNDVKRKIVNPIIHLFNRGIKDTVPILEKLDGIVWYVRSDDQPNLVKIASQSAQ